MYYLFLAGFSIIPARCFDIDVFNYMHVTLSKDPFRTNQHYFVRTIYELEKYPTLFALALPNIVWLVITTMFPYDNPHRSYFLQNAIFTCLYIFTKC